jgi:hypothetical protein
VPAVHDRLRPEVIPAILASGWTATVAPVGEHSTYCGLLRRLWALHRTFAVVEHDIVVNPDTLDGLRDCPEPWCAAPYPFLSGTHLGLGCVRFRDDLLTRYPDAMERVATMRDATHPPGHWCRLDAWLRNWLNEQGVQVHEHAGLVAHLDPRSSHGCLT